MISFQHWLVIVSALVSISGASMYVRDTIAGRSKPNRVSWFMWALAPLIGTAAALSAHADAWATTRTFMAGFVPLTIFIASFVNPKSYWKLTVFDLLCGAFSLLALVIWLVIDSPNGAVIFAILADCFALVPSLYKAWRYPETETGATFIAGLAAGLLALPSIPAWNIQNSAFQIYLFFANILLILAIYRKRMLTHFPYGK
jgi:hypothetical protein